MSRTDDLDVLELSCSVVIDIVVVVVVSLGGNVVVLMKPADARNPILCFLLLHPCIISKLPCDVKSLIFLIKHVSFTSSFAPQALGDDKAVFT